MEQGCRKEGVSPLTEKKNCGYSHSKSEKRPRGATGFNSVVARGMHTREQEAKRVLQPLAFSGLPVLWFNSL